MKKKPASQDHYYRRFGLDGDPFPVDAPDRVLFLTPELERRLQKLRLAVRAGRQLLLVTAPHGAGKSRLCRQLDAAGDEDWLIARVQAQPEWEAAGLAVALLEQAFPGQDDTMGDPRDRLQAGLRQARADGVTPVFVIDDAHNLPEATLAELLEWIGLEHEGRRYHLVLFAEERIRDRLQDLEPARLSEDDIVAIQLPALTEVQTTEYIRHRILSYGHITSDPFGEDTLAHIYRVSGGLPGGINHLAREAMQQPQGDGRGGRAAWVVAVLLVLAAGTWLYRAQQTPPAGTPEAPIAAPENDAGPPAETPGAKPEQPQTAATRGRPAPETGPAVSDTGPAYPEPETATEEPARDASVGDAETTTAAETPPAEPAPTEPPVQLNAQQPAPGTAAAAAASPLARPEQPAAAPADAAAEPEQERLTGRTDAATAPDHANVFDLAETPAWAGTVRGEDWLRRQPPGSVALQLISASRLENVAGLVRGVEEEARDFSGFTNYTPSGEPRYRLYYGLYPDRASAVTAIASLPPKLRRLKPWPRPLGAIHRELDGKEARFGAPR